MKSAPLSIALVVAAGALGAAGQAQNPRFRTRTDLIAVDVQVVDGKGKPVVGLQPDQFQVSVDGRSRKVVSVEFVRFDEYKTAVSSSSAERAAAAIAAPTAQRGRLFELAIDKRSFAPGDSSGLVEAARIFINSLQPTDRIGMFAYPDGPQVPPTTDHAAVMTALGSVNGGRLLPTTRYNLRPTEIIAISRRIEGMAVVTPEALLQRSPEIRDMLTNLCPPEGPDPQTECFKLVAQEVTNLSLHFESEASQSLGTLRAVLEYLGRIEGRKTLVLLSGGLVVSDQAGGRPDVGNLDVIMAQDAAEADTAIYTLYLDWKFLQRFAPSNSRVPSNLVNLSRDTLINSTWLDRFSTTAGGKLFTVTGGNGDGAFDRILSETSAHYLIGVEPADVDWDGRPHPLTVRVKQRGATVRARTWVALPNEPAAPVSAAAVPLPTAPSRPAAAPAPPPPATAPAATGAAPAGPPVPAPASVSAPPAVPADAAPAIGARLPPVITNEMSPALRTRLADVGAYVRRFDAAFANVVAEERYLQEATAGADAGPVVPRRELLSDFLLVTLPGTTGWVPFRDVFEVNGAPIRDREDRLMKLLQRPTDATIAQANAILEQSASYNVGVPRTMNLPVIGLEVFRVSAQYRFRFAGGDLDPSATQPAYLIEFDEFALPAMISGSGGRDLLMRGRAWIDAATGAITRTEMHIDDTTLRVTVITQYQFNPTFKVAVPFQMREEYLEQSGRRTTGTATYGRFRQFGVQTSDEMVPR